MMDDTTRQYYKQLIREMHPERPTGEQVAAHMRAMGATRAEVVNRTSSKDLNSYQLMVEWPSYML